jgi:hypothetical protein
MGVCVGQRTEVGDGGVCCSSCWDQWCLDGEVGIVFRRAFPVQKLLGCWFVDAVFDCDKL